MATVPRHPNLSRDLSTELLAFAADALGPRPSLERRGLGLESDPIDDLRAHGVLVQKQLERIAQRSRLERLRMPFEEAASR